MIEKDIGKRWEKGLPHHPKSVEIYELLEEADWEHGGDYFQWKKGGDGDNGETLMYGLDVLFELRDEAACVANAGGQTCGPVALEQKDGR